MYLIIASDGRTYGPVSAQEIRQWVTGNRANSQTLAQLQGAAEWRPLGSFPEFADLFVSAPPPVGNPPPVQSVVTIDVDQEAARINTNARSLDVGSCFNRAWATLTANFWLIVGATIVVGFIDAGTSGLLRGVVVGGLYLLMLKLIRGQKAEFGDAFLGFSLCFLPLFLCSLISLILTSAGLVFCVLPGLYLMVAWAFSLFIVIDRRLDFWPAMSLSMQVVNKRFFDIVILLVLMWLVNVIGFLCCVVGLFVSAPLSYLMLAYAYEDIFGPSRRAA